LGIAVERGTKGRLLRKLQRSSWRGKLGIGRIACFLRIPPFQRNFVPDWPITFEVDMIGVIRYIHEATS
jgi:hypothetical protein